MASTWSSSFFSGISSILLTSSSVLLSFFARLLAIEALREVGCFTEFTSPWTLLSYFCSVCSYILDTSRSRTVVNSYRVKGSEVSKWYLSTHSVKTQAVVACAFEWVILAEHPQYCSSLQKQGNQASITEIRWRWSSLELPVVIGSEWFEQEAWEAQYREKLGSWAVINILLELNKFSGCLFLLLIQIVLKITEFI